MKIIKSSDSSLTPVTVSIMMPVGRVDEFFPITLQSVLKQTYTDYELVIVCGDSIYSEVLGLVEAAGGDSACQVIPTRLAGVAFAANLCIAHARGELVARWDADDLCDPNRLTRQVEEFRQNPALAVLGTRVVIIDEDAIPNPVHTFKFYGDNASIRKALKYRQPLLHSALMFRLKILLESRGYLYGHTSEDHEMFIRIARNSKVVFKNLPDIVTYYRRHSKQLSDVSHLHNHFVEISGFMWTEFLRTWNPMYILGAAVNIPFFRRVRHWRRAIRSRDRL
jgi:glycosyltransferase involved in cell wall biosynthesis